MINKMEFFSEIYSAYYNTVAKILERAVKGELNAEKLRRIAEECAFSESSAVIEPALRDGRWQLLSPDMTTPLTEMPSIPLTVLQKRWLKAVSLDPRIKLFDIAFDLPDDIEPLFTPDDYEVFDRYSDGDDYNDPTYINNFRTILSAIKTKQPVEIKMRNRQGRTVTNVFVPRGLEYSEKDDKFRVVSENGGLSASVNIGRMIECGQCGAERLKKEKKPREQASKSLTLEVFDRRNSIERVMLHFAHFEKSAEKREDGSCVLHIKYDASDETEMVIRVLSFGPCVRVVEPESFAALVRQRLEMQKKLL